MRSSNVIGTLVGFMAVISMGSVANAGACKLSILRAACSPAKEKAMLKPYDGKNPTVETLDLPSEKECVAKAEEQAKIVRAGTLAKKTVTVSFDGKDLGNKEGTSECK